MGGNEEGGRATPTSISIFDSYDMKTLWFEFGHDIFTGVKMPTLSSKESLFVNIILVYKLFLELKLSKYANNKNCSPTLKIDIF